MRVQARTDPRGHPVKFGGRHKFLTLNVLFHKVLRVYCPGRITSNLTSYSLAIRLAFMLVNTHQASLLVVVVTDAAEGVCRV